MNILKNKCSVLYKKRLHLPVRTVNLVSRIRVLPLAKNICVWCNVAYGMMVRDE